MSVSYKELAGNPYFYKVIKIDKVVDGDTVDVVIDLGFHIQMKLRVRLLGYDAPETFRPKCKAEREAGLKVKAYLKKILNTYEDSLHLATKPSPSIYGRWLGTFYALTDNGIVCINDEVEKFIEENGLNKQKIRKEICNKGVSDATSNG